MEGYRAIMHGDSAMSINFAVIGCGMLARTQHIANIARNPRITLHTCCDLSEEALGDCRARFGPKRTCTDWRAVVGDDAIDAICLATTEKLRLPVIAAAAEAGKPVYVEKPLAATLEEARAIEAVVSRAGIPCCVGHNRRSSPAMQEAHAIFRRHMADPTPCPWRFDREGPGTRPPLDDADAPAMNVRINDDWWSWKGYVFDDRTSAYGPMLFEMTHFTDLCNWFIDAEPVCVAALETGMLNHGVVITYAGGGLATIMMGGNGTFGYPKELYEVMGAGGMVVVDHLLEVRTAGIRRAPAHKVYPLLNDRHPEVGSEGGLHGWLAKKRAACHEAEVNGDPALQFTAEPDKGHYEALDRFVDEIQGEGPVVCGIDAALLATRVALAAIRSAREQRVVKLSEV